jgi:hypothetical protein
MEYSKRVDLSSIAPKVSQQTGGVSSQLARPSHPYEDEPEPSSLGGSKGTLADITNRPWKVESRVPDRGRQGEAERKGGKRADRAAGDHKGFEVIDMINSDFKKLCEPVQGSESEGRTAREMRGIEDKLSKMLNSLEKREDSEVDEEYERFMQYLQVEKQQSQVPLWTGKQAAQPEANLDEHEFNDLLDQVDNILMRSSFSESKFKNIIFETDQMLKISKGNLAGDDNRMDSKGDWRLSQNGKRFSIENMTGTNNDSIHEFNYQSERLNHAKEAKDELQRHAKSTSNNRHFETFGGRDLRVQNELKKSNSKEAKENSWKKRDLKDIKKPLLKPENSFAKENDESRKSRRESDHQLNREEREAESSPDRVLPPLLPELDPEKPHLRLKGAKEVVIGLDPSLCPGQPQEAPLSPGQPSKPQPGPSWEAASSLRPVSHPAPCSQRTGGDRGEASTGHQLPLSKDAGRSLNAEQGTQAWGVSKEAQMGREGGGRTGAERGARDAHLSPQRQVTVAGEGKSADRDEEMVGHRVELKLNELRSKLGFLTQRKPGSSGVFVRLIQDTLKDFQQGELHKQCHEKHPKVSEQVDRIQSKIQELSKIFITGHLLNDQRIQEVIMDTLSDDLKALNASIHKILGTLTTAKKESPKPAKSHQWEESKPKPVGRGAAPEDDLNICVKRSEDQPLKNEPRNVSAKLEFDKEIDRSKRGGLEADGVGPGRNGGERRRNGLGEERGLAGLTGDNEYAQGGRGIGRHLTNGIANKQQNDDYKEPELLLTQKLGCRVYSMTTVDRFLVCGFEDGSLSVFTVSRTEGLCLERSKKMHSRPITCIVASPRFSKRVLLCTAYGAASEATIVIWDFINLKPLKELCGHTGIISTMEYISPNYLISASFDRKVIIWDLNECEAALSLEIHSSPILSSYFDQETQCLYTGALDSTIVVSGLVIESGEVVDCKILKTISGTGPVLYLNSYMGDKLISFQNSKIVIYDSRGLLFRDLKTNTLPNTLEMINDDKGIFVDINGKPFLLNIAQYINSKRPIELQTSDRSSVEKSSILMGLRLNGAYCRAQVFADPTGQLVVSVNEKTDTVFFSKFR